ncbi:MAG: NADPH-dependent FMN reductase [Bacteroidota bacterium]
MIKILGISGSLREKSFNSSALRAAQELAPEGVTIEIYKEIGNYPLYNDDIKQKGFPKAVEEFGKRIADADAVLIVTPEYNYSIPGVLKNSIDWVSRLPDQPFNNKPVALMGASTGMFGSLRAQLHLHLHLHLRQSLLYLNALTMNKPEVYITRAPEKFNSDGKLTDEPTREKIVQLLTALAAWTRRVGEK